MKTLIIECTSTDGKEDFQTELETIIEKLSQGFESGADSNDTNSYEFSVKMEA